MKTPQELADIDRAHKWREAHTDYSPYGALGPDAEDIAHLIAEVREETIEACTKVVIITGDVPVVKLKRICARLDKLRSPQATSTGNEAKEK